MDDLEYLKPYRTPEEQATLLVARALNAVYMRFLLRLPRGLKPTKIRMCPMIAQIICGGFEILNGDLMYGPMPIDLRFRGIPLEVCTKCTDVKTA